MVVYKTLSTGGVHINTGVMEQLRAEVSYKRRLWPRASSLNKYENIL